MAWSDVDWGNAPSWLAVVAAITAAGFAGRNVLVDVQDRRRQQASQVAAWWGTQVVNSRPRMPYHARGAWVRNASSLPVYEVRIYWFLDGVLWRHATPPAVPPSDEPIFVDMPSLAEYRRDARMGDLTWQEALAERVEAPNASLDVSIAFRDTAGRTWQRDADGALVEVKLPWWLALKVKLKIAAAPR